MILGLTNVFLLSGRMKKPLFRGPIIVKKSKTHGYGVFATETIRKNKMIEQCYTLISKKGGDKKLEDYYFDANGQYAILTGFGIIYNHASDPNADYTINRKTKITNIKATRTIKKGEEIFVSYGDEWFSSRRLTPKK